MKRCDRRCIYAIIALLLILLLPDLAMAEPLDAVNTWKGKSRDTTLKAAAPVSGFITDGDAWATLWKAWQGDTPVPQIDFEEHIVIVATVHGPNNMMGKPQIDDKGAVKAMFAATRMAGPGFGYIMLQVPREGIASVNGNALPAVSRKIVVPELTIEDNMGFAGTAFTFTLKKDGQWTYHGRFPKKESDGLLSAAQAEQLIAWIESQDTATARKISPDSNIADRAYLKLNARWKDEAIAFDVLRAHAAANACRQWVEQVIVPPNELRCVFVVRAEEKSFSDATMHARLWEYDPRLADAAAKEVGMVKKMNVSHRQGTPTRTVFTLSPAVNAGQRKADRRYYTTAQIDLEGKRIYYGKPEGGGIAKVYEKDAPDEVVFTAQPVDG